MPDLEFDRCRYDEAPGAYTYRWDFLKKRIDAILTQSVDIYQIVLDQPPRAFQQGYTFISKGELRARSSLFAVPGGSLDQYLHVLHCGDEVVLYPLSPKMSTAVVSVATITPCSSSMPLWTL